MLKQQPLAVPLSVLRDATRLFALTRDGAPNITQISRWQFQPGYATYPPGVSLSFVASQAREYGGGAPVAVQPLASFLRGYQLDGGYTPGPLLVVMTAAGAIGSLFIFSGRRSRRRKNGAASDGDRQLAVAALLASLPPSPWCSAPTYTSSPGATSFPRWSYCRSRARSAIWPSPGASAGTRAAKPPTAGRDRSYFLPCVAS